MRIEVFGRNIELTDAIRAHAEAKAKGLPKYFDRLQQVTIRLEKTSHQHQSPFSVELVCDVEKHADFVVHATEPDLYVAIDHAVQKAARQLADFKERLKTGKR